MRQKGVWSEAAAVEAGAQGLSPVGGRWTPTPGAGNRPLAHRREAALAALWGRGAKVRAAGVERGWGRGTEVVQAG